MPELWSLFKNEFLKFTPALVNFARGFWLFAAELTMPELQVKESWNQISADFLDDNPVAALANQFQVSEGALMIRLKEIKGLNKIW